MPRFETPSGREIPQHIAAKALGLPATATADQIRTAATGYPAAALTPAPAPEPEAARPPARRPAPAPAPARKAPAPKPASPDTSNALAVSLGMPNATEDEIYDYMFRQPSSAALAHRDGTPVFPKAGGR